MSMKPKWLTFPPPLQVGIPLLVLAFSLVYDLINTCVLLSRETLREYNHVQRLANSQAAWLADAVYTFHGGEEGSLSLDREIRRLLDDKRVPFALVCDGDLVVRYATDRSWVGRSLKDLEMPEELLDLVTKAKQANEPLSSELTR